MALWVAECGDIAEVGERWRREALRLGRRVTVAGLETVSKAVSMLAGATCYMHGFYVLDFGKERLASDSLADRWLTI